jgi:Fe-S-cluster containining protein
MAAPNFDELRPYHADQLSLVTRGLAQNRNRVFAIQLVKTAQEKTDALFSQIRKKPEGQFDCKPGCSYCCSYRIEALPPEIFLIAQQLRKLPADALAAVTARLRARAEKASGLRPEQHNTPCPLLVDSMCSVYESRPFACRRLHSLDVEQCKLPDGMPPENEELNLKAAAVFNGTVEGYLKRHLPSYPHELGTAVLKALEEPDAEERWYKGEQVFDLLPDMEEMLGNPLPILVGTQAPPR